MGLSVWTKYTADMVSTQRSESMNNELKGYISVKYDILNFLSTLTGWWQINDMRR